MKVKALSLWQPWASLMVPGPNGEPPAKTVETRSWPTRYRGPLAICSAKTRAGLEAGFSVGPVRRALLAGRDTAPVDFELPFGKALVLVDLVACVDGDEPWRRAESVVSTAKWLNQRPFGHFGPGRWAWVTRNPRRLKPLPVRGQQGLFDIEISDDLFD